MLELMLGGVISDGRFIEVGAFDCRNWSNTYGLAEMGWSGVYFEPMQKAVSACLENLAGMEDRVTVIRAALSDWSGQAKLYLGGSLSTIKEEARDIYLSMDWSRVTGLADGKTELVPVDTLDNQLNLLEWQPGFELLVVDVEGSEIDVLNGFDVSHWKPLIAIVETHDKFDNVRLRAKSDLIDEYFIKDGYSKFYSDHINTVYSLEGHIWTPSQS